MITATWTSKKSSPSFNEMRELLKKKASPGEPTLSRKEANRTWREDILGILSDEQRKQKKKQNQEKSKRYSNEDE
jgi:hypothetical protein